MLLWALHNLHALGWAAQPLYMVCLFAFGFVTAENVCARCIHFDSWHCCGLGKGVAKLFPQQDTPINQATRHQHFILLALTVGATLLGLFSGGLLPGAVGILWVAGASTTVFPKNRPFSWIVGRRKTAELLAEARNRPAVPQPQATPASTGATPGTPPVAKDGRCPNCGATIEAETRFCHQCGQEVAAPPSGSLKPAKEKPQTSDAGESENIVLEEGIPVIPVSDQAIPTPKPTPTKGPAATAVVRPPINPDAPTSESD